jgi:phage replication-related protein YjqB (UPF0714/DUF867 family)
LAAYLSNFLKINFDSDHHITSTLNYDDGIGEMMCLTNAEDHNIPPITLNYDDGIVSLAKWCLSHFNYTITLCLFI